MKIGFGELQYYLNRVYNWVILKYRHVEYGDNFKIYGRIFCVSNNRNGITIGNNVTINSCRASNPIGGDIRSNLFAKGDARIYIGNGCGFSNVTLFAYKSIRIGDNVLLGGGVKIYDTDFHWTNYERRMMEYGGVAKSVEIKEGAFVGAHSIILKGVTIGKKSIIGAGSVVTKTVPDGEIWAGNPAKYIKKVE